MAPLGFEPRLYRFWAGCLCQLDYGAFVVGVPGFEPGRSDGALCSTGRRGQPYPPDTRTFLLTNLAESLGIEPSRA